mmetsp:Transcript_32480/g.74224  ORF Transcript_32480/g.74224 Transcript_32480/m.74224 type:complete len:104 (+) Transcript_32480:40-351(+)
MQHLKQNAAWSENHGPVDAIAPSVSCSAFTLAIFRSLLRLPERSGPAMQLWDFVRSIHVLTVERGPSSANPGKVISLRVPGLTLIPNLDKLAIAGSSQGFPVD